MEKFEIALERAKKEIRLADHMMSVTFKVVQDPKLLLSVVERLNRVLQSTVESIVQYERLYKRIPPFQDSFESMFSTFKVRITRRYDINIEYITLIQEIQDILRQHKESPVEFRKSDKFIICSENYRIRTISADHIKKYIEKAKVFIKEAEHMVKNGRTS